MTTEIRQRHIDQALVLIRHARETITTANTPAADGTHPPELRHALNAAATACDSAEDNLASATTHNFDDPT